MTATVITYRGRSAVRDVGKAMGLGLDLVDLLAKQIEGVVRHDRDGRGDSAPAGLDSNDRRCDADDAGARERIARISTRPSPASTPAAW